MSSQRTIAPEQHSIIIIGAGFSGLNMAIRLKQAGHDDFIVLERAGDLGGTWRDNVYPGCACDVPSVLVARRESLFRLYAEHDKKICEGKVTLCGKKTRCFPMGIFLPFQSRRYTIEQLTRRDTTVRTQFGAAWTAPNKLVSSA